MEMEKSFLRDVGSNLNQTLASAANIVSWSLGKTDESKYKYKWRDCRKMQGSSPPCRAGGLPMREGGRGRLN